jgi:hypothetical protein
MTETKDKYACKAGDCCRKFGSGPIRNRVRACLIQLDSDDCGRHPDEASRTSCRRAAHILCYAHYYYIHRSGTRSCAINAGRRGSSGEPLHGAVRAGMSPRAALFLKAGLLGGFGGPGVGLAMFLAVRSAQRHEPGLASDVVGTLFGWWPFLYFLTVVGFGPVAALVALGGARLLIAVRVRGAALSTLAAVGAGIGGLVGAAVLPVCSNVLGPLLRGAAPVALRANPYWSQDLAAGAVTGVVLGVALAVLVARNVPPASERS